MPGTRSPSRRLTTEQRRAHLIEVGVDLFSTRAYDELGVGEIAAAAGLSKGLLYHYFPGKREFYVAVVAETSARLEHATAPDPTLPEGLRLLSSLDRYLDYVEEQRIGYTALMQGGLGADPEVAALLEQSRQRFAQRVLDQLPAGVVTPGLRLVVRGWVAFAETVAIEWVSTRTVERDEVRTLLAASLAALLAAAGAEVLGEVLRPDVQSP